MLNKPETIHGYKILATFHTPGEEGIIREGRLILVDKGSKEVFQRYVSAWQGATGEVWDPDWSQSHYVSKLRDAWNNFVDRCERWIEE